MTIKVRLSGEPAEISALVEHLRAEFEVAGGERAYPNRGSFGVRVYLEARPRTDHEPLRVSSERVTPSRTGRTAGEEIEP